MTTPVSFKIAKLLKEKGFDKPTIQWYHRDSKKLNTNDLMFSMNKLTDNYSAPTIADVVMWLYEKQGIWISVDPENDTDTWFHTISYNKSETVFGDYNTPTEAYEAAIEHCLKNII